MSRLLLALAVIAAPVGALAQEPRCSHEQAMSCAEGSVWDAESRTCVPVVG